MSLTHAIIWTEVELPPKDLSPNAHRHWRSRYNAAHAYKAQCAARFKSIGALTPPVTIHLEFYLGRGQATFDRVARRDRYFPKDADNARASFKYGQDALVLAGIIPEDGIKYVRCGRTVLYTKAEDHHNRACVMVGLEVDVDVDEPSGEWVDELSD